MHGGEVVTEDSITLAGQSYLKSMMQPGAHRVDLQGNLTPVSPEHAASAAKGVA